MNHPLLKKRWQALDDARGGGEQAGNAMATLTSRPSESITSNADLVAYRKQCRVCVGLINPAECANGLYDSDHIGPWSVWQGSLSASLMVVGQDWGDEQYFVANAGQDVANNPTNEMLRELLMGIGVEVAASDSHNASNHRVFFTNAVLCLKNGGMQAQMEKEWVLNCASRFLRPTIEVVKPRFVITLGEHAYRAVVYAYQMQRLGFKSAVEDLTGFDLGNGTRLFPVYLCCRRIFNTHRPMAQQRQDWERIRVAMSR
jgi:uracil-DNA glycosylase